MIYDIRHVTTYEYENPVSFARCTLRLEPRGGVGQELISHEVEIHPRPAERNVRRDFFGTLTESVTIEAAHRNLRIDSRSRVSVSRRPPARAMRSARPGRASATSRSKPPASGRPPRSVMSLPVPWFRCCARSAPMRA
ncbi:transglutaminase-like putative cysteine protease [Bradyrhizobium yuanmingense]